jgi:glycosyltransferase involved in cell wall biosynthesis
MNVVIVDGDISYPATSGKRLRTLNLMLRLAQRHDITYIGRGAGNSDDARQARTYLGDHGIRVILVDHPVPKKSGTSFFLRLAANAFSPLPYSVASHASAAMRRAVTSHAAQHTVDLWQFEWAPYMSSLPPSINGARLIIAHNVDTLIWQRYYETARGMLRRAYLKRQWQRFQRFEQRAFVQADRVVAVSPDDARLIREHFGMSDVDVVENGVDTGYFQDRRERRDRHNILFLGALDWRPNLDATGLLLHKILPAVRAAEPEAKLLIVGRNPPSSLRQQVAGMANVELHADVPDVRPFLANCGVLTVPLRIGGGSRLKILEALASGLPVVSSRVGAEGLELKAGEHFIHAEEDEMAEALVQAIRQPERGLTLAANGRQVVLERYDWDGLADKLEESWEKCVSVPRMLEDAHAALEIGRGR